MDRLAENIALLEPEELAVVGVACHIVGQSLRRKEATRRRRLWARPWLLRRPMYGQYETLLAELMVEDVPRFKNHQRIDPDLFHELLANRANDAIYIFEVT